MSKRKQHHPEFKATATSFGVKKGDVPLDQTHQGRHEQETARYMRQPRAPASQSGGGMAEAETTQKCPEPVQINRTTLDEDPPMCMTLITDVIKSGATMPAAVLLMNVQLVRWHDTAIHSTPRRFAA